MVNGQLLAQRSATDSAIHCRRSSIRGTRDLLAQRGPLTGTHVQRIRACGRRRLSTEHTAAGRTDGPRTRQPLATTVSGRMMRTFRFASSSIGAGARARTPLRRRWRRRRRYCACRNRLLACARAPCCDFQPVAKRATSTRRRNDDVFKSGGTAGWGGDGSVAYTDIRWRCGRIVGGV